MAGPSSNDEPATAAGHPLAGRVAIVTGASRGIGREVALHLASLGADVVVNYAANAAQADLVVAEINSSSSSSRAVAVQADVSNAADVKGLFDLAEAAFSRPAHILVNCAGVLDPKYPSIAATSDEDWDRAFGVNARGAFLCAREAANRLVRGVRGQDLAVHDVAGGDADGGAYTVLKAAVEVMEKIMVEELKGTGITANCVAPGPTATDMFFEGKSEEVVKMVIEACPFGRLGQTSNVAPLIRFLANDAAEWING